MTGLMMTVAMLGAIGGQAPLSFMVVSLGWRGAMMFIGLIGFILVFLFTGAMLYKQTPFFSDSSATTSNKLIKDLFLFIKNKRNWLLSLYTGFAFAPFSAFAGLWGISFLQQAYHLPKTLAASATSFIFIGFAIGCPLLGWISDYLGRRLPIMFVATVIALLSLCVVIYLPVKSTILLSFLLFNFGFWVSSLMLSFTIAREAQNTLLIASIMGFMNTIPSLFEAFTAPLIGKMLDMGWNHQLLHGARVFSVSDYRLGLSLLPAYLIIALLLLAFITESKRKNSKLIAQNSYKTAKYFYIKP
jgi:sugar phosphate permease